MKKLLLLLLVTLIYLNGCGVSTGTEEETAETSETVYEVFSEPEPSYAEVEFVNNNEYISLGITEEMNEVIKKYFIRTYGSLGTFADGDYNDMYYFNTEYELGIANTMLAYQNQIRRDMAIDLCYDFATVGVTYISATETHEGIDVYLTQNDSMNYNFISDITSYTSDVEHHFILKPIQNEYYIVKHSEISGVYKLITERFDSYLETNRLTLANMTENQINDSLETLKHELVEEVNTELTVVNEERNEYNSSPDDFVTSVTADNPYNAEEALKYSYQWIGKDSHVRNPAFTEYDIYGGNCNNFTSQCLFASGIPMDLQGKQWKWYGEEINNSGGRWGRSQSWAACEFFYKYCTENSGFGLVTDLTGNLYSGKPGDIIQYVSDGVGVHSVIITKVIYDEDGNVLDYLINSNTTDKIDCPMSLYGYTDFRLIKIIGHND